MFLAIQSFFRSSLPIVFAEIVLWQPLICEVPEIEPYETLGFWYCIPHQIQAAIVLFC